MTSETTHTHSKCSRLLYPCPPAHLGEKLSQTIQVQRIYTNSGLSIFDSSYTETGITLLECIDPHLVSPILPQRNRVRKTENTKEISKYSETEIKMEEFSDLTMLLPDNATKPNSSPLENPEIEIFSEKEKNNLTSIEFQCPDIEDTEIFQFSNQNIDNDIYNHYSFVVDSDKSDYVNDTIMTQFSDLSSNNISYDCDSIEDSYNNSHLESTTFESTNSNTSSIAAQTGLKPNFQLTFDNRILPDLINTPDVIDAVTSLENSFKIPTNTKVLPQVEKLEQDMYLESSLLPVTFDDNDSFEEVFDIKIIPDDEVIKEFVHNAKTNTDNITQIKNEWQNNNLLDLKSVPDSPIEKRTRKRPIQRNSIYRSTSDDSTIEDTFDRDFVLDDDQLQEYAHEDDDYVPPKKSTRQKKYSFSNEEHSLPKRRGRPPGKNACTKLMSKRVDQYRELRDKNNEASRKSRLKRRIREQELMDEAEGLSERNTKLKAHVAELEKAISNYRQNLFKMMLKK